MYTKIKLMRRGRQPEAFTGLGIECGELGT